MNVVRGPPGILLEDFASAHAGLIPESAALKINLCYFNPKVREQMINAIRSIDDGIAKPYGVADDQMPTMTMKGGSTPLVNDDALVTDFPAVTGSEDVHLLLADNTTVPFAFVLVGVADPAVFAQARKGGKPFPYAAHNPNCVVDLAAIPVGTEVAMTMVMDLLAKSSVKCSLFLQLQVKALTDIALKIADGITKSASQRAE